jgi:hypothetical protein
MDPIGQAAVAAWNVMGGVVDWSALPLLADMYGVADLPMFVAYVVAIRDEMKRASANG